ncbi:MAG TPA: hypothetical protein VK698_39440 [Kofleriaceae bacterium]|nr:hypothetical protein [Kofleriaceae bacterium]
MLIVQRSEIKKGFSQPPNEMVFDERLGMLSRMVLVEILARPPGWQTNAQKMWEKAHRHRGDRAESKRAFRMAFAELEEYGYLTRVRSKVPAGQPGGGGFVTTLTVYNRSTKPDI